VMVLGQNQAGVTITLQSHSVKHILLGGQTGSGKTVAIRAMAAQISQPCKRGRQNQIILIDGKDGTGLSILNGLRGQVGPLAINMDGAVGALGWAITEMKDRARTKRENGGVAAGLNWPHIYVFFDEFQTWTLDAKNIVTAQLHALLAQGREVSVHVIGGTQKPLVASFGKGATGSAAAGQLDTRIGLSLEKQEESRVMMGVSSKAQCHRLFGGGDSYVKARDPHLLERVQIAYINEVDLQRMAGGQLEKDEWPEFDTSILERETARVGRRAKATTAEEYAIGIETVEQGLGRPHFRKQFSNGKRPGADRARKVILPMCEEIVRIMRQRGVVLK
jgi:S-DNA-T family DNA segregation ATPase FtsK/SpoIIIE